MTIENHSVIGGLGGLIAGDSLRHARSCAGAAGGRGGCIHGIRAVGLVKEKYGLNVEHVLEQLGY